MTPPGGRVERGYRLLLKTLPARQRERFAQEMEAVFAAELARVRRESGAAGRIAFLLRSAGHALWFGLEARMRFATGRVRGSNGEDRMTGQNGMTGGNGMRWESLSRDVRMAARSLAREPGFTLTTVLALGLGIGLTTTAFSIVWGTLLKGLPFDAPEELVHFERADRERNNLAVTPHDFVAWREAQRSFEDLAAYSEAIVVLEVDGDAPERVEGSRIQPHAFGLLNAQPALGRLLAVSDDEPGAPPVVLLSEALWRRRFQASPDVLGTAVRINDTPHTVIGVMPEGFRFPLSEELWVPLRLDLTRVSRGEGRLDAFGRLRDGVSLDDARADFARISGRLAEEYPGTNAGIEAELRSYVDEYVDEEFRAMIVALLVAASLVLLVASLHVANLMLVRGARRAREVAVRVSLGAARGRVVQSLLAEALVIAAASACLGIALAWFGVGWFAGSASRPGTFQLAHGGAIPFWWDVRLDAVSLAFVLLVAFLSVLISGLAPARRALGVHPGVLLRHDARAGGGGNGLLAQGVVAMEIALAGGVLVIAGLMAKSVTQLADVGSSVETEGVVVASIGLPDARLGGDESALPDVESRRVFWASLRDRLLEAPEVESASVGSSVPFLRAYHEPVVVPGYDSEEALEEAMAAVDDGYFDILGVQPLEGRLFERGDGPAGAPVVIVNRSFRDRYFPGAAVGRVVELQGPMDEVVAARVVGVVPDLYMDGIRGERPEGFYRPLSQAGTVNRSGRFDRRELRYARVLVRPAAGASPVGTLREAVAALAPGVPVYGVTTLEETLGREGGQYRLYGTYYMIFGATAFFMVVLGLYGLVAYSVGRARREIGVRVALGASAAQVTWTILRRFIVLVGVGVVGGVVVARWLQGALGLILYQVEPDDPFVTAVVFSALFLTAAIAAAVPASAAARVDPVSAIKAD